MHPKGRRHHLLCHRRWQELSLLPSSGSLSKLFPTHLSGTYGRGQTKRVLHTNNSEVCKVNLENYRFYVHLFFNSTKKRVFKAKEASSKTKKVKRMARLSDMVNECVRHEGSSTYCQIDKHSQCKFRQTMYNPWNFSRHFRLKHPNVADERGFFKLRPQIKTEKREGKLCDKVEECGRRDGNIKRQYPVQKKSKPVIVDSHKIKLAEKVPNFTVRRKASSGRTRYLCNIQPPSGCAYYEPLLHIGNKYRFVNHFIRRHADAALANGFEEAEQSTGVLDYLATILPPSKRNPVRALVDKFVTKEGVGARCHIRPESGCTYSQKVYITSNFVRHFYQKHPSAFEEHGFSFHESTLRRSDNAALAPPLEEEMDING